jgi:simple sugar transport system permease protein
MMFVIVAASWFVLTKTRWGLRVRSCGENPHAAETLGVNVIKVRYQAVILGGLIAGLGGAWFSMESQGGFQDNMTNGAGFIALAALIFGKWRPWSAFAGAMLFGFTRALGTRLQILGVEIGDFAIPSEFWQSLPYVVTIVVVAGAIGRAIPPAAIGQPYEKSR